MLKAYLLRTANPHPNLICANLYNCFQVFIGELQPFHSRSLAHFQMKVFTIKWLSVAYLKWLGGLYKAPSGQVIMHKTGTLIVREVKDWMGIKLVPQDQTWVLVMWEGLALLLPVLHVFWVNMNGIIWQSFQQTQGTGLHDPGGPFQSCFPKLRISVSRAADPATFLHTKI